MGMNRVKLILCATILSGMPSMAFAYCPQVPDDASSHYVDNNTRHMLCLKDELSDATQAQAAQVQLQQQLANLQAQINKQLLDQSAALSVPTLQFPTRP
jgi:hypothetical protein